MLRARDHLLIDRMSKAYDARMAELFNDPPREKVQGLLGELRGILVAWDELLALSEKEDSCPCHST